ncbi:MAG: hypothetical protein PWP64_390 [Candidatus Cloacimonadota bacterium]|nr:hypothetical protein [Candidatus Cloacimonadota bacterium]
MRYALCVMRYALCVMRYAQDLKCCSDGTQGGDPGYRGAI